MSRGARIAGKCQGPNAHRADARLLRDAYLIALGRQALRKANERRSHRDMPFEPNAGTAKPRGRAR